jgi:hypothetical protein
MSIPAEWLVQQKKPQQPRHKLPAADLESQSDLFDKVIANGNQIKVNDSYSDSQEDSVESSTGTNLYDDLINMKPDPQTMSKPKTGDSLDNDSKKLAEELDIIYEVNESQAKSGDYTYSSKFEDSFDRGSKIRHSKHSNVSSKLISDMSIVSGLKENMPMFDDADELPKSPPKFLSSKSEFDDEEISIEALGNKINKLITQGSKNFRPITEESDEVPTQRFNYEGIDLDDQDPLDILDREERFQKSKMTDGGSELDDECIDDLLKRIDELPKSLQFNDGSTLSHESRNFPMDNRQNESVQTIDDAFAEKLLNAIGDDVKKREVKREIEGKPWYEWENIIDVMIVEHEFQEELRLIKREKSKAKMKEFYADKIMKKKTLTKAEVDK